MGRKRQKPVLVLGMTALLSALIGASATMAGMVGGFLVLRHTRIRTEIQDSGRRQVIAEAELAVLNRPDRATLGRGFDSTAVEEPRRKPDENKEALLGLGWSEGGE